MEKFPKMDNIFTIKLPNSDLVFTQYLYIKEEVRIALLVSILNKSDDALFWAYELYNSGFKYELLKLIWKIYYDFFATLNPSYESYLIKKQKELLLDINNQKSYIISSIIQDLLYRPFNTDVFMLRNICENFNYINDINDINEINEINEIKVLIERWIQKNDFRAISNWILNINKGIHINVIYDIFLNILNPKQKNKLTKQFMNTKKLSKYIEPNIILLAKIMCLVTKEKAELPKEKKFYMVVEPEEIIPYEPINGSVLKHNKILEYVYTCGIDDFQHQSLFKLTRNKYNIKEKYCNHWLYHASFSPIWAKRIHTFKGYTDYINQKVIFYEDELMEEFYDLYGLEPDEQPLKIQNKSISKIEKIHNWKWFNEQYKKNNLFDIWEEELEEFDNGGGLTY